MREKEHLRGIGNLLDSNNLNFIQKSEYITTFSVYSFIITMLIYRNYDSTASLDAFCVEEGINSLLLNNEQSIEDISDIIDTGIITQKFLPICAKFNFRFDQHKIYFQNNWYILQIHRFLEDNIWEDEAVASFRKPHVGFDICYHRLICQLTFVFSILNRFRIFLVTFNYIWTFWIDDIGWNLSL